MIEKIWQSEETMEEAYVTMMSLSKFNRTDDANKLVNKIMGKLMPHPTFFDKRVWVTGNIKDFNLASQILLNCQDGSIHFKLAELEASVRSWGEKYSSSIPTPFAQKAKFIPAESEKDSEYNLVLAEIRNLKILSTATVSLNSYRVSPIGSTPALADRNNLSQLSTIGLRKYLGPGVGVWLIDHEEIQMRINLCQQEDGGYVADGLSHPIYSKSGGDIVTRAITSRWAAYQALLAQQNYVVPKYDSLLLAGEPTSEMKEYLSEFNG